MIGELLDFLFPRRCVVCARELAVGEVSICSECLSDVPYTYFWSLELNPMAVKINGKIEEWLVEREASASASAAASADASPGDYVPFSQACALMFYRHGSAYRDIPMQIKYYRNFDVARLFGRDLGSRMAAFPQYADVDCIIPVPLHLLRRLKRGYNQAELLARGIAEGIAAALPSPEAPVQPAPAVREAPAVRTDILKRRKYTRTQTLLSAEAKLRNVESAFIVSPKWLQSRSTAQPTSALTLSQFHHILLVDDVCTTGATMFECYKVLRAVYPGKISFATLSYFDR